MPRTRAGLPRGAAELALVLHRQNQPRDALAGNRTAAGRSEPRNPGVRNLKAAVLGRIGEYEPALEMYAELLDGVPGAAEGVA